MKASQEIQARAQLYVTQELERRLAEAGLRLPHRCVHNHRQVLDTRRTVEDLPNDHYNRILPNGSQTIGLCMLGADNMEEWPGTICEDPIDAQRCPFFVPTQDREAVLKAFREDLANPEWIAKHMPELGELLWVLDETSAPRLTWLQRALLFFRRPRLEPVRPAVDPLQLLPDNPE